MSAPESLTAPDSAVAHSGDKRWRFSFVRRSLSPPHPVCEPRVQGRLADRPAWIQPGKERDQFVAWLIGSTTI